MLLRLVFILFVLFPSFAFAHEDDKPQIIICDELLSRLLHGKKPQPAEISMVKHVSRHPYKLKYFENLLKGFGYEGAAQIVFTQFLRDGIWILESEIGEEERIAVRSVADNRSYFPSQYSNIRFINQDNPADVDFYKYAGITSYIEMLSFKNISETGFSMSSEHDYMPGGSTDLTFGFNSEGFLETLEFGVVLGEGPNKRDLRKKFKVKGYLNFPNTLDHPTFDIRRMK